MNKNIDFEELYQESLKKMLSGLNDEDEQMVENIIKISAETTVTILKLYHEKIFEKL